MGTSQAALVVKNLPANAGDIRETVLASGLGKSPGGGNGNSLQYSSLGNPKDRGAWRVTILRISKSWTQLRDFAHTQINLQKWSTLILAFKVKRSMNLVTSIYGFSCLEVGYVIPSKFAPKFGLPKIGCNLDT